MHVGSWLGPLHLGVSIPTSNALNGGLRSNFSAGPVTFCKVTGPTKQYYFFYVYILELRARAFGDKFTQIDYFTVHPSLSMHVGSWLSLPCL